MKRSIVAKAFLLFFGLQFSGANAQGLDAGLTDLANQISVGMSGANRQKIAVVELSDLKGEVTDLGKYVAEELVTKLFKTGKFNVIERQLLHKILAENKLQLSGVIDETTARKIGVIAGVDAICSGTITDLVESIKINARLIDTETGGIFAVAATAIKKDNVIQKLLGQAGMDIKPKPTPSDTTKISGSYFIFEDFSKIPEGAIPSGWQGAEKSLVKKAGRKKVMTNFEPAYERITIPAKFPENFRFDWVVSLGHDHWARIGDINIFVGPGLGYWTACRFQIDGSMYDMQGAKRDIPMTLSLEKRGDVFRLFADGVEMLLIRKPGYKSPTSFTLEFKERYQLHKLVGIDLGLNP